MAMSKHFNLYDSGLCAALRILPSLAGRREYRGRHPSIASRNPRIVHEYLSTRQLQDRKTPSHEGFPDPGMIENLSELICRQPPLL